MIFIGADGGGTGTMLAACENGRRIAEAKTGPLNYRFIPAEEAVRNLTEGIAALGTPPERIAAVGIADPSLDDAAGEEDGAAARFYGLLGEALSVPVFGRSDAYITLFGLKRQLNGGQNTPAILMISGTGAMGIAENSRGEIRVAGGWGRMTGDEGSGWFIAVEGIRAAFRADDGIGEKTALGKALLTRYGAASLRGLIPVFYGDHAPQIASFAEDVADCAERGDAVARGILSEAARFLAAYAAELVRFSGARTVGIYGSVLTKNRIVREEFEQRLRDAVGQPQGQGIEVTVPSVPAEEAAARYAETMIGKTEEDPS
ncbi:MAG: hypothetical protein E7576_01250 [Ruminococcaceae bacterium]|jgi:N-acetylglucosamine kinase-like BadF-type ATPase|nr:hypothetical protein [Oscillospiraceae bacterium]